MTLPDYLMIAFWLSLPLVAAWVADRNDKAITRHVGRALEGSDKG